VSAESQYLSATEINAFQVAWAGGQPGIRYVRNVPPHDSYYWNGTALVPADQVTNEVTPKVQVTATGTAFTGACELAGWLCSVAAGTITIYDALSATGTPIVPAETLTTAPRPIFGVGHSGKLQLVTGCHVVLSGAATVNILVGA
jgi:hypothetical protein